MGFAVSAGKATLLELSTVYGVEDLYDIIEIIMIDAHNERVIAQEK
ncbi:transcription elongation factor GreA (plasmid) [Methylobacterium currus]|uniref:Transcription elongation factor GreA n=1 Tax=Methylobacterium currus TaxID=2051553 RepID=A0A2R4WXG3_9HYPH|nr:transcription elongation factor GreA [Methylobacterium currus]